MTEDISAVGGSRRQHCHDILAVQRMTAQNNQRSEPGKERANAEGKTACRATPYLLREVVRKKSGDAQDVCHN